MYKQLVSKLNELSALRQSNKYMKKTAETDSSPVRKPTQWQLLLTAVGACFVLTLAAKGSCCWNSGPLNMLRACVLCVTEQLNNSVGSPLPTVWLRACVHCATALACCWTTESGAVYFERIASMSFQTVSIYLTSPHERKWIIIVNVP